MKERKKLVVIDDDPRFRELFEDTFSADFEVTSAKDWDEGAGACREEAPAAVIVDLFMPRVNGLSIVHALAEDEATRDIPVLVVSSSCVDAPMRLALAAQSNVRRILDKLSGLRGLREAVAAATA